MIKIRTKYFLCAVIVLLLSNVCIFYGDMTLKVSAASAPAVNDSDMPGSKEDMVSQNTIPMAETAMQHDYIIYVNRACNCVTVMEKDISGNEIPVKAFVCSCGKLINSTPLGSFQTSDYYDWREMFGDCYARYAVRFSRNLLFHSVPYNTRRSYDLDYEKYNQLGSSDSLGCVRLAVADAKWIFDNTTPGTQVVIYSDPVNPGALGKPEPTRIDPSSPNRGWDPTDDDLNNPWLSDSAIVSQYQSFDEIAYATMYPDLSAAYGTDKMQLWRHYVTYGKQEGRVAVFR